MAEPNVVDTPGTSADSTAPRRDKFASLAAKQQQEEQSKPPQQQQQTTNRRGKFAKLAAAKQASTETTTNTTDDTKQKFQGEAVQRRMDQRNAVLRDLKKAEGLTWRLVSLASDTARALSDLDSFSSQGIKDDGNHKTISNTAKTYRETLQQIHSLLTPHAHLVVPYQNHKVDTTQQQQQESSSEENKVSQQEQDNTELQDTTTTTFTNDDNNSNDMYAARVEMRLAMERRTVLKELLRLEQLEGDESNENKQSSSDAAPGSRKRSRQE